MTAGIGLDAFYDYARQVRSLQSNAINAPVTAPKALYQLAGLESLGPGKITDKPIYFFLFHQGKT
jgi:hypothetical protein